MFIVPMTKMPMVSPAELGTKIAGGVQEKNSFSNIFQEAFKNVQETQNKSKEDAYQLATGGIDNMHEVIINGEKAATALEFAVQLSGKAVGAYNEIMRMQI